MSERKLSHVPSATQREALIKARDDGPLKRIPGGFWVEQSHNGMIYQGGWYLGTPTIDACERRGWLEPCGDFEQIWRQSRRITDAGRAILSATNQRDANNDH